MQNLQSYDPDFWITESTTVNEKNSFINEFREYHARAIAVSLGDLTRAEAATFEFLSRGIRAGLRIPDIIGILIDDNGILLRPVFQGSPRTKGIIEYIRTIELAEVYEAAGVDRERDFYKDAATGKWRAKG